MAMAMTAMALDISTVKTGTLVKQISPAGTFAAGTDLQGEAITLIDLADMAAVALNTEEAKYLPGYGNFVSDNGTVVGSLDASSSRPYYYDSDSKAWTELLLSASDSEGIANGISADGNYICGQISNPNDGGLMLRPVVWSRLGDGSFGEYVALPYPTVDFTGRTPQYVTAICINQDGTIVVGQMRDYSGAVTVPMLYTKAANGEWSYKFLWDVNPDNVEVPTEPEYPQSVNAEDFMTSEEIADYYAAVAAYYTKQSECPQLEDFMDPGRLEEYNEAYENYWNAWWMYPCPDINDYVTEEEKAAYDAAYAQWEEELGEYPQMTSFMTEDELAAYDAAVAEYNSKLETYNNWSDTVEALQKAVPEFEFNNMCLSAKGSYAVASAITYGDWLYGTEDSSVIYLFDLDSDTYSKIEPSVAMKATYVNDNGVILAAAPLSSNDCTAYIKTDDNDNFVELLPYMQDIKLEAYEWMKENMVHTYSETDWEWNGEIGDYEEITITINETITGSPCADSDLNVIGTWAYNKWDENEDAEMLYSYFINAKDVCGISEVQTSHVSNVEIFDLNGRRLPNAQNLVPGVYIVRTIDANGNVSTKKVKY